jgi:putative MATE family efflux protein
MKKTKSFEMDMCSGNLLQKIILFSIPLIFTGILQLLYNAADLVVVGKFAGDESLAAVSSTGSLINLIVNVFMGLSVGTCASLAKAYGAKHFQEAEEIVHTSIAISIIFGVIVGVFGYFFSYDLLVLMASPEDVIDLATIYLKIYFIGMPFNMLYNFGAAILRAVGDTKRPLYYLSIAGIINVILNLVTVICFHMGVAGVALATITSQAISSILVLITLQKEKGCCHFSFRKMHVHKKAFLEISRIGLPAGLQGSIFSLSNVVIQSTVNSYGSIVMSGNGASSSIEGFIYTSMNSFYQAALTFCSQNVGAKKFENTRKVYRDSLLCVCVTGFSLGLIAIIFGKLFLSIYTSNPEAINYGLVRLQIIAATYFLCGIMDVSVGELRGFGYSIMPMIVSLVGACGLRILWIMTIYKLQPSLFMLYISYPISWLITASTHLLCYAVILPKQKRIILNLPLFRLLHRNKHNSVLIQSK